MATYVDEYQLHTFVGMLFTSIHGSTTWKIIDYYDNKFVIACDTDTDDKMYVVGYQAIINALIRRFDYVIIF